MRSLTFVCVAAARVVFRCLIGASRPALAGLLAAAALCALRAPLASAQTTYSWDPAGQFGTGPGSDGSANWDNSLTNWYISGPSDSAYTNGSTNVVDLGTSANTAANTVTMNAPIEVGTINFAGGSGGSYTIAPNGSVPATDTLTIDSQINMAAGAGPATISAPVILGAANAWVNNSSSLLTVSGNITNSTFGLTVGGTGSTTISGAIVGATTGGLTMNGTGTLTLNGSAVNTYTGATTINSGTLLEDFSNLSSPTNLIDSGSALVLGGGTLRINGNASSATSQTFAGLAINPGASTISLAPTGGLTDTLGFTNNTTITRATGATLNFAIPANGAVNLNPTLAAGIVGPWATIGSGGAIQYAMTSSGAIAAYTYLAVPAGNQGTAIASAASITDTSGTVNYSLSAAGSGTAGASASINTLQYTGSGLTLAPGSGGLTANGIMNVGNGTLTIQTNSLIIGSNGGTNNELVITGPGNDTISSLITNNGSGASALTVASTGTVTLNALNAFTGGTFVNAGTLTLPTSTNSPIGDIRGALTINSGGTVNASTGWSLGYVGGTCVSTIAINGGTLNFTGAANAGGTSASSITMTGGTISAVGGAAFDWYYGITTTPTLYTLASSTTATISSGFNLRLNAATNNLTLNVAAGTVPSGVDLLVSGNIVLGNGNAGGGITKTDSGTAAFSGSNTYNGATTISAGTLEIGNGGSTGTLPTGSAITDNGTLVFDRSNAAAQGTDFAGSAITGTGIVVQNGSGTTTLSGTAFNSYSGGTIVNAGTLTLPASTNIPFGDIRGALTINSGGTVSASNSWSMGYANGTCVSTIAINGGTLNFTAAGLGGGTSASSITMTGGTISGAAFDWYNGITNTPTLDTLASSTTATVSAGINLRLGATTDNLTLNVAAGTVPSGGDDLLISGNVVKGDTGGGITKMGSGTAELSGTGNSYNGATIVDAGTLIMDHPIFSSNNGTAAAGTIVNGGTLTLGPSGGQGIVNGTLTINSGGTVNANTGWSLGYSSSTVSVNNLVINGGTLNFTGAANGGGTAASSITMTGGTISGTAFDWYVNVTNGVTTYDPTLTTEASPTTATISSGMNLRVTASGILTLDVAQGSVPSNGPDLLISGPVVGNSGEPLQGGGITKTGLGTAELSSTGNTYNGATIVDAGTLILDHVNTHTNSTIVNGGTLVLAAASSTGIINGSLTINSGGTVDADTGWSLGFLNGGGNYCVSTIAINGGTLYFTRNLGLGQGGTSASSITMTGGTISGATGATFDWYNGITNTPTLTTLASSTTATVSAGINVRLGATTNDLTLNVAAGTVTSGSNPGDDLLISGNISQTQHGGIIKTGNGTAELSGSNNYDGGTTVDAGTLILDRVNAANSSTIVNGGTLKLAAAGGTGIINGSLTINSGATVVANTGWSLGFSTLTSAVTSIAVNGGTLNFTGTNGLGGTAANSITMTGGTISGTPFDYYYNSFGAVPTLNTVANSAQATISSGFNVRVGATNDITLNVAAGTVPSGIDLLVSGNIAQGSGGGGIAMTGGGTAVLSGVNSYTGGTVVNQGTLIMTSPSNNLANGGLTVAGGTFAYEPSAAGPLQLGSGVITLADGSTVGAALGGTASQSAIVTSGTARVTGAVAVNVYGVPGAAVSSGSYNLITASGGGLSAGTYTLGNIYNATNFTVTSGTLSAASDTALTLTVTSQNLGLSPANEYWLGGFSAGANVWALSNGTANSNWTTDQAGMQPTSLVPGTNTTVTLSANGATNQGSMTLGANMSIAGLVANDTTAVMVLNGGNLTIGAGGITINNSAGSPNLTLATNLTLGAAQTWQNASASPLLVTGNVTNGGNLLTVEGAGNTTISGVIGSGAGGLTQAGAGTLILTAANTYTGATTITSGTLQLGNGGTTGSLSTASNIAVDGTLAFDRSNAVSQGTDFTASAINGAGSLAQLGAGTTTLSALNTYGGGTIVAAGTLTLTGFGTFGNGALLTVSGGTADLAGVSLIGSASVGGISDGGTSNGTITSSSGTPTLTVNITGSVNQTYGGTLSGSLALIIDSTNTGSGAQALSGPNTYSGGTTVNAGTLLANGSATSTSSSTGTGNVTVNLGGSLGGSGAVLPTGSNRTVSVLDGGTILGTAGQTLTINGTLSLAANALAGSSIATLAPGAAGDPALISANSLSAPATGTARIEISNSGSLASGTYDLISYSTGPGASNPAANFGFTSGVTFAGGVISTLQLTGSQLDLVIIGAFTWNGEASTNWDTTSGDQNWAAGSAASPYIDGANVIFGDTDAVTTNPLTTPQTVTVNGTVSPYSVVFQNNSTLYVIGGSGSITGNTGLTLNGSQSVTLQNANSFSGPVAVNAGQLILTNSLALGNASQVTVAPGSAMSLQSGNGNTGSYGLTANNSSRIPTSIAGSGSGSGALVSVSGNNSYGGSIVLAGNATIGSASTYAGDGLTLTGGITGTAPSASTQTLIIAGAGNTTIGPGAPGLADGSGGGNLGLTMNGSGTSTLILTAASTYSGPTQINSGTLRVANSSGSGSATGTGTVNVNNSSTLAGNGGISSPGSIAGAVTVGGSATIAPSGGGVASAPGVGGTLTVGALTLNGGSQLIYQAQGPMILDSIAVSSGGSPAGVLTLPSSGQAEFSFYQVGSTIPDLLGDGTYQLMTYNAVIGGGSNITSLTLNTANYNAGEQITFSTSGDTLELTVGAGNGSGTWTSNGSMQYGIGANWSSAAVPDNTAGNYYTATFGGMAPNGMAGNVLLKDSSGNPANFTVGGLDFTDTSVAYNIGYQGFGSLTLDNGGVAGGPSVVVDSGVVLTPYISASLILADSVSKSTMFNVAGGSSLDVAASISESTTYTGQSITLTGGGTLYFDGTNFYTGSTTVNGGSTLDVGYNGIPSTLGNGTSPLAINDANSTVNLYNSASIGDLSGTGAGMLNVVNSGTTLTVNQSNSTQFAGTLSLASGTNLTVTSSNNSTLTIAGAPTFSGSNMVNVNSGTLAFDVTSGTPTVGTGVTVAVASGATLQLAGSVSALSAGGISAAVNNSGTLKVTGTNQTVGVVSGVASVSGPMTYDGNTVVGDGSTAANLTATQILQNSLTINAGSTVTIAPAGDPPAAIPATSGAVATDSAATADTSSSDAANNSDPFTAIQSAIASGAISSTTGQVLENRIAAIERLAAVDPGLDASLLESRVLAALPSAAADSSPIVDAGSGLFALDSSALGSDSAFAASAAFPPSASFAGRPAAVPEPSTLVLAALAGNGMAADLRRRSVRRG